MLYLCFPQASEQHSVAVGLGESLFFCSACLWLWRKASFLFFLCGAVTLKDEEKITQCFGCLARIFPASNVSQWNFGVVQ